MKRLLAKACLLTLSALFPIAGDGIVAADEPVPFIANEGQCEQRVLFYARSFGGTVFLDDGGEIRYQLHAHDTSPTDSLIVSESFLHTTAPGLRGQGRAVTRIGYFRDDSLSEWRSFVSTYDLIDWDSIYIGVNVVLTAFEGAFEKRFEFEAGLDPQAVSIRVKPADNTRAVTSGDLTINTAAGLVRFARPVAFQIEGGRRKYVDVAYELTGDEYRFVLGPRDPLLPTTIIARTTVVEPTESRK